MLAPFLYLLFYPKNTLVEQAPLLCDRIFISLLAQNAKLLHGKPITASQLKKLPPRDFARTACFQGSLEKLYLNVSALTATSNRGAAGTRPRHSSASISS
jgi:hypothetical protein